MGQSESTTVEATIASLQAETEKFERFRRYEHAVDEFSALVNNRLLATTTELATSHGRMKDAWLKLSAEEQAQVRAPPTLSWATYSAETGRVVAVERLE